MALRWEGYVGIGAALLLIAATFWFLFGWTPEYNPSIGKKVHIYRHWGQRTEARADTSGDGRMDLRILYRRKKAAPRSPCPLKLAGLWEDRDHDGRWDTWTTFEGPTADGRCRTLWEADTDGDGERDWQRTATWGDESAPIYEELKAKRGF